MKFIGTEREFGKVIIGSEVTLQNPDMMVALFMLMIMTGALGDPDLFSLVEAIRLMLLAPDIVAALLGGR